MDRFNFSRRLRTLAAIVVAVGIGISGCASKQKLLSTHFQNKAFGDAAELAAGDPSLTHDLAVWIVREAAREDESYALKGVSILKQAKAVHALQILREMPSSLVGRLATVALFDASEVSDEILKLCTSDPHGDVRAACVTATYSLLPVSALKEMLVDTDPRVRFFAVKGLASQDPSNSNIADLLVEALRQDPASRVRAEVATHGALLGADAFLWLKEALFDSSNGVRLAALRGFSEIGSGAALNKLTELAAAKMDMTAVVAATELARKGLRVGKERLNAALTNSRAPIRIAAMMRLERARYPERFARIAKMLTDRAPDVVLTAANLLRHEPSFRHEITSALRPIAEKKNAFQLDAQSQLAALGDEKAVLAIAEKMKTAKQAELVLILNTIANVKGLTAPIVERMGDKRIEVRLAAAEAVIF